MADTGRLQKMDVDYSSTVDEKLPHCEKLVQDGRLEEAVEILLNLEKQTRTASDMHSTARILVAIVKMCHEKKRWDLLNENIVLLTKRRGQLKQAVTKMVQEAFTYVDKMPDKETQLKLIDTLRTVTAGKIYVEIERARLTRILAQIREDEGNIAEAATVLQELQVETYGSMEKKEKVEFILEQMRLCLAKKDFIRTQIISKKINTKYFDDADTKELKLKFYQLMIELGENEEAFLSNCRHYKAVFETPAIQEEPAKRNEALVGVVCYVILAPYDNEQSDLIHRIQEEKKLEDIPKYKQLLTLFTTSEIMRWKQVCADYEHELKTGLSANIFNPNTDAGQKRWNHLKIRVVEHNIRVMAKYYTKVRMGRMAELLDLTEAETEEFLSKLVVNKTVQAKMDRLDGIVSFSQHKDPNDILNDWSINANELMNLMNKTTHLITKEEMVQKLY